MDNLNVLITKLEDGFKYHLQITRSNVIEWPTVLKHFISSNNGFERLIDIAMERKLLKPYYVKFSGKITCDTVSFPSLRDKGKNIFINYCEKIDDFEIRILFILHNLFIDIYQQKYKYLRKPFDMYTLDNKTSKILNMDIMTFEEVKNHTINVRKSYSDYNLTKKRKITTSLPAKKKQRYLEESYMYIDILKLIIKGLEHDLEFWNSPVYYTLQKAFLSSLPPSYRRESEELKRLFSVNKIDIDVVEDVKKILKRLKAFKYLSYI